MTFNQKKLSLLLISSFVIVGCAGNPAIKDIVYDESDKALTRGTQATESIVPKVKQERPLVESVKGLYVPRKSIPVNSDLNLPPIFERNITAIYPGATNVSTVAERITKVTGIPVKIKPDVYLKATSLIVAGSSAPASSNDTVVTPINPEPGAPLGQAPTIGPNSTTQAQTSQTLSDSTYAETFELNYDGSLSGLLDRLSSRLGISWEYKNGQIELYRLLTRTFVLKANPGATEFASSLGKDGGESGFASSSKVTMESQFSVWQSVENSVRSMLSTSGKLSVSQATGTITITDTKQVVESVAEYIDRENNILTRMVSLKVEILSVRLRDADEFGLDWDLIYRQINNGAQRFSFTLGSPTSLTSAQAGGIGFNILAPIGEGLGQYNGSSAIFNALASVGRTNVVTTSSATTLNRQPVPVAITNQVAYLAETTPAQGGIAGGNAVPGLKPGIVTTGFLLNFLPTVLDSNSILLQFSLDISELQRLGTFSVGSGVTQQAIQTPEVSGTQFLQRVAIKPGETLILSGYDRYFGQYDQRTLDRNGEPGLGGSRSGRNDREILVILVSPIIREGI
jgi:type IVB pilus formation R64 PilN family outer membrane protein